MRISTRLSRYLRPLKVQGLASWQPEGAVETAPSGWSRPLLAALAACVLALVAAAPGGAMHTSSTAVARACVVPKVKGKSLAAAKRAITGHGCTVGRIRRAYSSTVRKGRVISQRPGPDAHRPGGAKVSLVVSRGKQSPPPPPYCPAPIAGTAGLHSTACIPIQGQTVGASEGFGSLWARTVVGLYRIDAATNTVSAEIQGLPSLGTSWEPVATGDGAVWTSNIGDASVSRIDPATNRVVATIPVWPSNSGCTNPEPSTGCPAPMGIAITPGAVWVVLHHEWKVVRIDPTTNTVVATISIGSSTDPVGPQALTTANGYVYVNGIDNAQTAYLEQIDPADNSVTKVVQTPGFACDEKAGDGNDVWLATQGCDGNSIDEVDVTSKSIVGHVALGAAPAHVSIGLGSAWVTTLGVGDLVEIDPSKHAIVGRISTPPDSDPWVASGEGTLWLACWGFVYRIEQ